MSKVGISVASKTEKGRRRTNEDACLALTSEDVAGGIEGLFVVADGMGGRASGAIASSLAVNAVRDAFTSKILEGPDEPGRILAESLQAANDAVYREATSKPELEGMGTTCAAAAVQDGRVFFAHMGDSRIYLFRDGELRRLTEDHSFVAEKVRTGEITEEQARKSRFRNVITRALGLEADAQPAVGSTELQAGDVLLLCTDGLTIPVSGDEIADILCSSSDLEEACDRLVKAALRNGGSDNVTAVVAAYGSRGRKEAVEATMKGKRRAFWLLPALIGLLLGVGIGLYAGRTYLPTEPPVKPAPAEPDLAHVEYEDPVSLLHTPLQGELLALDRRGYLHVVDRMGRLVRLDTSGQKIFELPGRAEFVEFAIPRLPAMASDPQDNLYISDRGGKKILKFGSDGSFLGNIGEGKLMDPGALAVDDEGAIYVVDAGRLKTIRPKSSQQPAASP